MKIRRREFLGMSLALGLADRMPALGAGGAKPFVLTPGVPVVVAAAEPAPVRRAARDLARDLRDVLGAESPLLDETAQLKGRPAIIVIGPGSRRDGPRHPAVKGWESHGVFAREAGGAPCVILQGADVRGTVYAIYTFSEKFLGIPPLWLWASLAPQRRERIEVKGDTEFIFGPPHVKWRAWFPNDEDLFIPWQARAEENYDALLETMLRLKLNTLEGQMLSGDSFKKPYTVGKTTRAAQERGLAVTGHHVFALGSSLGNWAAYWRGIRKQEAPALAIANKAALEEFWKYHIETALKNKLEVIWQISFRGNGDKPFWETYKDAPAEDAARAKVIAEMMRAQVALLKRVTGDPAPPMRTTLYNENSDFFAAGLMRPPEEPTLIWNFVAARRDHYPAGDIRRFTPPPGQMIGYYMNFQFTSSGAHLAQAEGPWKMERNYRMVGAIGTRPLEFSVVNMGNIREFVLEGSANAAMMWDWKAYDSDGFLREFCARYFGAEHAAAAAGLYRDFYESYWTPKKPDLPDFPRQYVFQDQRYARAAEQILAALPKGANLNPLTDRSMDKGGRYFRIVPEDSGAASQIEALRNGTAACLEKLKRVTAGADALFAELPEPARPFFNDNLRVQARFMLHLNGVLNALARAMLAQPDRARTRACLAQAREAAATMREALREAEHGQFEAWYAGDRLFGLNKMAKALDAALKKFS